MADLCTLDDVRMLLELPDADTGRDALISALIPRASDVLMDWCGREFAPVTLDATRTFDFLGGNYLPLRPFDAAAVASVVIDADTTAPITLVEGTDYWLEDRAGFTRYGIWDGIRIMGYWPTDGTAPAYSGTRRVAITGDWGWPAIPNAAIQACAITVCSWMDKAWADFQGEDPRETVVVAGTRAVPSAAKAILGPLYRYTVG